jgi:hypothetical protein
LKKINIQKIYREILKTRITLAIDITKKYPRVDWETLWINLWTNKRIKNRQKETFYKLIHGALPVGARFKNLVRGWKCPLCKKETETLNHILKECNKVRPTWAKLQNIFIRNGWGNILYENIIVPNFKTNKKLEIVNAYVQAVWRTRNACRGGATCSPLKLFTKLAVLD